MKKETEPSEEVPVDEKPLPQDEPEELDLGLPAPEETLRKVDALLAGESTAPPPVKDKDATAQKARGGITTVIAKVMIGIGNKPYVRGEGPGLSWEEGVPMNFLEIGKWAWSPSRKMPRSSFKFTETMKIRTAQVNTRLNPVKNLN